MCMFAIPCIKQNFKFKKYIINQLPPFFQGSQPKKSPTFITKKLSKFYIHINKPISYYFR